MGSIIILRAFLLLFGLPSLLFGAYVTLLYCLIQKIRNFSIRILTTFGIAILFLLIKPVYLNVIITSPWTMIPDFSIMAMAVLLPFLLIENHLQAKRKEIPVFVCAFVTFLYLFISGFAAVMGYSGTGNVGLSFIYSIQSDYLFKVVYGVMQFLIALITATVVYGIIFIIYRIKNKLGDRIRPDTGN